ncbi:hypothetical protein [Aeromonas sp. HMWF014]|uniref:hypothetical protein n=1 Tax=Aeromonas sp. HMWF014 TaxID=2056850 RepID=UPI0011B23150|nr:hypothetical protein [Aeromonas sp. HMWF014]
MKKYTLSLLTLSVALSSGAAFAGTLVGAESAKSVDVTFEETSIVGHTLTQVSGLQPGDNVGKIIAQGKVTTNNTGHINMAFTGSEAYSFSGQAHRFAGVADNKIWVTLQPVNGNLLERPSGDNTGAIRIKPDTAGGNDFSYTINVYESQADVAADTYRISVKAQRWVV